MRRNADQQWPAPTRQYGGSADGSAIREPEVAADLSPTVAFELNFVGPITA